MTKSSLVPVGLLALAALLGSSAAPSSPSPLLVPPRPDPDHLAILLIDAQPAFFKTMAGPREPVEKRIEQLLLAATVWATPVLATFEHDPERNGWLPERLESAFPEHGKRLVKRWFDCCRETEVRAALDALRERGITQIAVAGAETDVCVLQSVLGLRTLGFEVFLLEDCLFSNEPRVEPALLRMRAAGAIPCTYKTLYYELEGGVAGVGLRPGWRERWRTVRDRLRSPYALYR